MDSADVDRLYSLPLEEFTEARDGLVESARRAGDAEKAAELKGLRKPTTPAWAVNQLAHRHRARVENLLAVSDRLREAQRELLKGGAATDLWEATLAEREAVGELVEIATKILTDAGYGATRATLERVADTLYAGAVDAGARELLRRGQVTKEMKRAGFGEVGTLLGGEPAAERPALRAVRTPGARGAARAGGPSARQRLEADRDAERLSRQADKAEMEADRLAKAAERADEEARLLARRATAASETAGRLRAEAAAARKAAAAARRGAERASDRVAKMRR